MNNIELNKWIENSPYTEKEEVIILLRKQQEQIDAFDYDAVAWALQKLHNFGVTQNNMDNAMMADRLELMLKMESLY